MRLVHAAGNDSHRSALRINSQIQQFIEVSGIHILFLRNDHTCVPIVDVIVDRIQQRILVIIGNAVLAGGYDTDLSCCDRAVVGIDLHRRSCLHILKPVADAGLHFSDGFIIIRYVGVIHFQIVFIGFIRLDHFILFGMNGKDLVGTEKRAQNYPCQKDQFPFPQRAAQKLFQADLSRSSLFPEIIIIFLCQSFFLSA